MKTRSRSLAAAPGWPRARCTQRVDRVARHRLETLSGPARHLLETAAVLGRSFRLHDAAAMLGETPAGLLPVVEEAADAGLVSAADDAFSFRHELIWHAVTEMIPRRAQGSAPAVRRVPAEPRRLGGIGCRAPAPSRGPRRSRRADRTGQGGGTDAADVPANRGPAGGAGPGAHACRGPGRRVTFGGRGGSPYCRRPAWNRPHGSRRTPWRSHCNPLTRRACGALCRQSGA